MPGHRRAHLNEYLPEAQWGRLSEVVVLGEQSVPGTNVHAHRQRECRGGGAKVHCADGVSDGVSIYV